MATLALVILAAGESRRLGTCKALVRLAEHDPSTPLALLLDLRRELAGPRALVVTGVHHAEIAREAGGDVDLVVNEDWRRGRSGSVACAARARPGSDLLIAPVDVPLVHPSTIRALAAAWENAGAPARGWLGPRTRDSAGILRYGHPVVLGRGLALEVEAVSADAPLALLRGRAEPLLHLEVEDGGILFDLDLPSDVEEARDRLAAIKSPRT